MKISTCILTLITLLMISPVYANDMPSCMGPTRDEASATLKKRYKESLIFQGVTENRTLIELYVSDAGSWTMFVVDHNGCTIPLASGNSYIEIITPSGDPA